jgi:septum formation protein
MIQLDTFRLVLGSKSPRRSQLMSEAGLDFDICTEDTDESFSESMPVLEVAEMLAIRKSNAILSKINHDQILITADSVVILDDVIYNKPAGYDEAKSMLSKLCGRMHKVATGVCVATTTKTVSFTEVTHVHLSPMSDDELDYYISKYEPYDKAGSYGIQDWIGLCKISRIEGSYTNVMGLPTHTLYHVLKDFCN